MCCLRVMHLADENRAVVTSLVLVDFPAGLESSLRLLLASRGTRQGQHYRLLVISSNQDRRQTAHARTALTASACLVWVLLRASWFSALSVKILFLFLDVNQSSHSKGKHHSMHAMLPCPRLVPSATGSQVRLQNVSIAVGHSDCN
jgi:hypothetical protein